MSGAETSAGVVGAAEVASLVDALAVHIEGQHEDPDAACNASQERLSELLSLAPSQLEDPKGHPLLAKLWGMVGQHLAQESGPAFCDAEELGHVDAAGEPDPVCSPTAAHRFLEPIVNSSGVAACIQQARDLVATQAAAINWDDDSLLKADARRQSSQRPDILTFSDSDTDDDDDGASGDHTFRRRSSSQAHLSRASGGSLPAGGMSLLLGSTDDSDGDLDMDFGPDIGKLVADLGSPELRVAALKKLTSSRVYAEDLCYGPNWQQLFDSLALCLMPTPHAKMQAGLAAGQSVAQAVPTGAAEGPGPVPAQGTSTHPAKEVEVRQPACQVLLRLVPECNGSSPQHAAHLLLSLAPVLEHLKLVLPAPQQDANSPSAKHQQLASGDALLLQLHEQSPVDAQLVRQAHKLLVGLSKDWHLIKAPTQARVATFICNLLAACLQPSPQGSDPPPHATGAAGVAGTEPGIAGAAADAAAGAAADEAEAAVLQTPLLLVQMDRNLHWLQRLCSAASSCKTVLQGAAEARLPASILAALEQQAPEAEGALAGNDISSLRRHMACVCAACLVMAPQCEGAQYSVGHPALAHSLMEEFCRLAEAELPLQGQGLADGAAASEPDIWQHRCPCWVPLLCNVASSSPGLLAGAPAERLLGQLMALCRAGPERLHSASQQGGGWWLDAAAALLQRMEGSHEGRQAVLACSVQLSIAPSKAMGATAASGTAAAVGGAGARSADSPLILSIGLGLLDAVSKGSSASGTDASKPTLLLSPAARSCVCSAARLLGRSALQLRRAGQLADAALRLIKFDAGSGSSLGFTARRSSAPSGPGFAAFGQASGSSPLNAPADCDRLAASSIAADVLVCLCGTPLSALHVCRRPAAANAAAYRLCQLLAEGAPKHREPMPGHQALAEVKRRRAGGSGAARQQMPPDEELLHSVLVTASVMALSSAGQQALITQGLTSVVRSWLEGAAECPELALALQRPPTDSPALATLLAAQSVMCWHRIVSNLAACFPGQELLRLLVTWLDNNPGIKPPPSRGLTPAMGLRGIEPPGHASSPTRSHEAPDATGHRPGPSARGAAPVPRSPEACHLALRCLMMAAHDVDSLLTLEQATNVRWYLQQLLDTACGPAMDLRMAGIVMEAPIHVPGGSGGGSSSSSMAPAAPAAGSHAGETHRHGEATAHHAAISAHSWDSGLDTVLDLDTPGARYLVARLDMLGPPPEPNPSNRQQGGKAAHRGRPPSTPGALLDATADHLAQVVRGDAGMVEPGVWLAAVRQALIMDVQLPTLSPAAVALMLQRLVMVALHAPARQLQGLDEAGWAPTCQPSPAVGMQFRGQARADREVPPAQQFVSWSCVRAALGTQPHQSLPGFSLDLALTAPTELVAAAGHVMLLHTSAGQDPLLPFQLLGTFLKELQHSPASPQAPSAQVEAATEVLGLSPVDLVAAHARLSLEVACSSLAGQKGDGQGSGGASASDSGGGTGGQGPPPAGQGLAGAPAPDMFLLWVVGIMQGYKPITLDLLADLSKSPAAAYWWPCFGSAAHGDTPRLTLCTALQVVLEVAEPSLWGACMAAKYHPCHAASRWLDACFFGFLPPAEASKAMALALGLGPDYLVYCCIAMLKHVELEVLRWQALYGLLPQGLHCRLMPDFSIASNLRYMLNLEKQHRKQVLALLFPASQR